MPWREVKKKPISIPRPAMGNCPRCGGIIYRGPIPCPEGRPGCLVAHIGNICGTCGRVYRWTE